MIVPVIDPGLLANGKVKVFAPVIVQGKVPLIEAGVAPRKVRLSV